MNELRNYSSFTINLSRWQDNPEEGKHSPVTYIRYYANRAQDTTVPFEEVPRNNRSIIVVLATESDIPDDRFRNFYKLTLMPKATGYVANFVREEKDKVTVEMENKHISFKVNDRPDKTFKVSAMTKAAMLAYLTSSLTSNRRTIFLGKDISPNEITTIVENLIEIQNTQNSMTKRSLFKLLK